MALLTADAVLNHVAGAKGSSLRPLKLSALRSIGWTLWNPIGLSAPAPGGPGDDEYDVYLIDAANQLLGGAPRESIIDGLVAAERESMGLPLASDARSRAEAAIDALAAYVAERPITGAEEGS